MFFDVLVGYKSILLDQVAWKETLGGAGLRANIPIPYAKANRTNKETKK